MGRQGHIALRGSCAQSRSLSAWAAKEMSPWFADTFYFLALRNLKDVAHSAAVKITRKNPRRRLITTAWVLTEVADALASPENRGGFSDLLSRLQKNSSAKIIGCDQALFEEGIALYEQRSDKAWSLTDC